MGEEGILMCFAFFSDTKVGMHRTSGSFTSQIAMRYRTSRTLYNVSNYLLGFRRISGAIRQKIGIPVSISLCYDELNTCFIIIRSFDYPTCKKKKLPKFFICCNLLVDGTELGIIFSPVAGI